MTVKVIVTMLCDSVGGLFVFIFGMKYMSDGIQAIAGSRLRQLIGSVTDNRLLACGVGVAITSLIQSSSVTSVMVIGLTNAGLMTLAQAIGVILGADIGTTITAWIVSLNIIEYGLPIMGIAGFFYLFARREQVQNGAMLIMGIGLIFFGLEIMKDGVYPLRDNPQFIHFFMRFRPDDLPGLLTCILMGSLFTALIQSSSATIAITITLARTGAIDYLTAVALVLGQNIGTTITAYLASLGATATGKRTAWAHILIKIAGVLLVVPVFRVYIGFLDFIGGGSLEIARHIALAHTLFNVFIVLVFMPFVRHLVRLLTWLIPEKEIVGTLYQTNIDHRMLDAPAIAIQQSMAEVQQTGRRVQEMYEHLKLLAETKKVTAVQIRRINQTEEHIDVIQKELVEFLGRLLMTNIPPALATEIHRQFRLIDEYESVSDYIRAIAKLIKRMDSLGFGLHPQDRKNLAALHQSVAQYLGAIQNGLQSGDRSIAMQTAAQSEAINEQYKKYRREHLERIEKNIINPLSGVVFVDILQSYHKIKSHVLNIAEVLAGEK